MTQVTHQKALLQLIADVTTGSATAAELEVGLVFAREALGKMEEQFQQTLEELTPEVQEQCEDIAEQALHTMDLYRTGLDLISGALASRNQDELFQGGELVRRAGNQLELQFSAFRNQALVAQGPTQIPNLNLQIRTLEAVRDNKVPMQSFLDVVNQERLLTLHALDGLKGAPGESEYGALNRAFDDHLRCMNRLARAVEAGDEGAVDQEMEKANKTFSYLAELIPMAQTRTRTQGPTKSPQANLVISYARDVAVGGLHQEILLDAVEDLKKEIAPLHHMLGTVAQVASVLLQEEAKKATEALNGYQMAFKGFDEFVRTRSPMSLLGAARALEQAANRLHECYEKVQSLLEREGKVACVRCGEFNTPGRSNCSKCGAGLPVLSDKPESSSTFSVAAEGEPGTQAQAPVRSSNLDRIYAAVDKMYTGAITADEFAAELDWFEGLIDSQERMVGPAPSPDLEEVPEDERELARERAEAVKETQQLFEGGIADWRAAVEEWRNFLEVRERRLLDEGKNLCDQGARKLLQLAVASQAAAGGGNAEAQ